MEENLIPTRDSALNKTGDEDDDMNDLFVGEIERPPSAPESGDDETSTEEENKDMVDEAFMQMGGFGRLQKLSYVMNTLAQGSAAFFLQCFVFLEKEPVYKCLDLEDNWETCE